MPVFSCVDSLRGGLRAAQPLLSFIKV